MHLIYNIFNPQQSNARAACANAQGYVVGCITKGDDAQQTIAAFIEGVKSMKAPTGVQTSPRFYSATIQVFWITIAGWIAQPPGP